MDGSEVEEAEMDENLDPLEAKECEDFEMLGCLGKKKG